jgi:signal transduction histidine kinase/ligand-binding sensor domain-containing protein
MQVSARLRTILFWRVCALIASVLIVAPYAGAERLPIQTYDTSDGLSGNFINRIVQDSRGYIWFSTRSGLSRFDGSHFVNYTTQQGLPNESVNYVLESRTGEYWIATNGGGVCRFRPESGNSTNGNGASDSTKQFIVFKVGNNPASNFVDTLLEDSKGRLWAGTDTGVFRMDHPDAPNAAFNSVKLDNTADAQMGVNALLEDRHGIIWLGSNGVGVAGSGSGALYRYFPDDHIERYAAAQGLPDGAITSLLEDRDGSLWVGTIRGLGRIFFDSESGRLQVVKTYSVADGLSDAPIGSMVQSVDGDTSRVWIATAKGICVYDGKQFRSYRHPLGANRDESLTAIAKDRAGDIWFGTEDEGAIKVVNHGFVSFDAADGLLGSEIAALFRGGHDEIFAISSDWTIQLLNGQRWIAVRPALPAGLIPTWKPQSAFRDHTGQWWILTNKGLYRYAAVTDISELSQATPLQIYSSRHGLIGDVIYRVFEDSHGDMWMSVSASDTRSELVKWDRATETLTHFTTANGLPSQTATAFGEGSEQLWVGFGDGSVWRWRNDRFVSVALPVGGASVQVNVIYFDRKGRLWIGRAPGGLSRIDDPKAELPRVVRYTEAEGLASNNVRCLTEDQQGRIYVGHLRGVDRLDPGSGVIKHFTRGDGLVNDYVTSAERDDSGNLWFGTLNGLSRLTPIDDPPTQPPLVLINGLHVAGIARQVSRLGEIQLRTLRLEANERNISIDFSGIPFSTGEPLRYQYRLEGTDPDWSTPVEVRTVNYANLSPGSYRFVVRAIAPDGTMSTQPATFAFVIPAPVWQRAWFIALLVIALASLFYLLYRYRLAQLLAVERVRGRIATDLHDDIGASLSQISILSEVVRRKGAADPGVLEPLGVIARTSRDLIDAMSDIVWANNPKRDHLADLAQRVNRFGDDLLTAHGVLFDFESSVPANGLRLAPEVRRQVYLVCKEAINNIARHSSCTETTVAITLDRGQLRVQIRDNGRGFDASDEYEGNGLRNMRQRVASIGGEIRFTSASDTGTTMELTVPIKAHPFLRRRTT